MLPFLACIPPTLVRWQAYSTSWRDKVETNHLQADVPIWPCVPRLHPRHGTTIKIEWFFNSFFRKIWMTGEDGWHWGFDRFHKRICSLKPGEAWQVWYLLSLPYSVHLHCFTFPSSLPPTLVILDTSLCVPPILAVISCSMFHSAPLCSSPS